jgi:hypothetical protein
LLVALGTLVGFLLVVEMGLQAVAVAFAIVACCHAACMLGLVRWMIHLKWPTYLLSIRTAVVATAWMSLAAYLVVAQTIIPVTQTGRLLAAIVVGGIAYGVHIMVTDRPMALKIRNLLTGRSDGVV